MKAFWMFLMLVGCWTSTATHSLSSCTFKYKLQTVCIPAGHNATVTCPELTGELVRFNFLKNQELIYSHKCNNTRKTLNCTSHSFRDGGEPRVKMENKSARFELTAVNASSHAVYLCVAEVLFPPPLPPPVPSPEGVVVLVEGHQCNKVNKQENHRHPDAEQRSDHLWIWILVIVSVIIYSTIITVFALSFWVKLKKTDSQSDYMNTKPRPPRGPRKNRGVQNPAPRYF
ncbi:T-cell-specific surface glycoprotein CD28-like [Notolabrus celidotus]|uniref:T-cell-specific surface glycoprotein CD28-like n=1 Tax=Notolabrus celidotus TaxID=1203425 RepID=UPI00148FFAEC|nr:T-cell-specific surface glycoprotein CD28-like [Notolabrus celidotus]